METWGLCRLYTLLEEELGGTDLPKAGAAAQQGWLKESLLPNPVL